MTIPNTPGLGDTVRLGKAKTAAVWEIIEVHKDGTYSLSKLGGTGYVNKTAKAEDFRHHEARVLETPLHAVLELQESVRRLAAGVNELARFPARSNQIAENTMHLHSEACTLHIAVQQHKAQLAEHFPDLTNEFNE